MMVQQDKAVLQIALMGNPNSGKSTLFNRLTGLQQKVGNFPGVTVEKKEGRLQLSDGRAAQLIDFPGSYSLYPNSKDERIVVQTLANPHDINQPDLIIYVADVNKLEKHFLLFSQLRELQKPIILVLNMTDVAERAGLQIRIDQLRRQLGIPVVTTSGRTGEGIPALQQLIDTHIRRPLSNGKDWTGDYRPSDRATQIVRTLESDYPEYTPYQRLLLAHHHTWLPFLNEAERTRIGQLVEATDFVPLKAQVEETLQRFDRFTPLLKDTLTAPAESRSDRFTQRLDSLLTHRWWGPLIFFALMLLVFQAIFAWATVPMDWIDQAFSALGNGLRQTLPAGLLTDLLIDGILAGLSGIVIFVPQIAILFFLIGLLEEAGYMARAAFIFDRVMQVFGLNGKSIVALISGGACAVPAIMSTRNISNPKERLITTLVTPFISCSARIPVYAVLIAFVVPAQTVLGGLLNLQGLAFMGLYLLGIVAALLTAMVFKWILRTEDRSFLMLELPDYKAPNLTNVGLAVFEKVKAFLLEAGKIILMISIVLWVLSTFGPSQAMQRAEVEAEQLAEARNLKELEAADLLAAKKLEASYAGHLGKAIEPAIEPLGFDWKIGIALITSFAAREVFVGTMATIYSLGSNDDTFSVRQQMRKARDPDTGQPVYTLATSLSLLLFYVFAMQCMSTLAVVKRETNTWKWPIIQFLFMTALAYLSSLVVYQTLG